MILEMCAGTIWGKRMCKCMQTNPVPVPPSSMPSSLSSPSFLQPSITLIIRVGCLGRALLPPPAAAYRRWRIGTL